MWLSLDWSHQPLLVSADFEVSLNAFIVNEPLDTIGKKHRSNKMSDLEICSALFGHQCLSSVRQGVVFKKGIHQSSQSG